MVARGEGESEWEKKITCKSTTFLVCLQTSLVLFSDRGETKTTTLTKIWTIQIKDPINYNVRNNQVVKDTYMLSKVIRIFAPYFIFACLLLANIWREIFMVYKKIKYLPKQVKAQLNPHIIKIQMDLLRSSTFGTNTKFRK